MQHKLVIDRDSYATIYGVLQLSYHRLKLSHFFLCDRKERLIIKNRLTRGQKLMVYRKKYKVELRIYIGRKYSLNELHEDCLY